MRGPTILVDCTIVDGVHPEPIEHGEIIVVDGRLSYVGPTRAPSAWPADAQHIDVEGKTILPGLIDAHIHMSLPGDATGVPPPTDDTYAVLRAAHDMETTLLHGFTAVRDVGGRNYMEMSLRRAIEEGITQGPRLVLCGKIITVSTVGSGIYKGMYREANSADQVVAAVREQIAAGADCIKMMLTGFAPGEDPALAQYSIDEVTAAVGVAHAMGKKVAAHAQGAEGIRVAVEGGVDTVEHGCGLAEEPTLAKEMAAKGIQLVPTLSLYEPMVGVSASSTLDDFSVEILGPFLAVKRDSVRCALEAGVSIAMGRDSGGLDAPHGGNAHEITLMVEAGLSPMQAIHASTRNAARALGKGKDIGTLEVGKLADLLVLDESPLEEISRLEDAGNLAVIMKGGEPVYARSGQLL